MFNKRKLNKTLGLVFLIATFTYFNGQRLKAKNEGNTANQLSDNNAMINNNLLTTNDTLIAKEIDHNNADVSKQTERPKNNQEKNGILLYAGVGLVKGVILGGVCAIHESRENKKKEAQENSKSNKATPLNKSTALPF